MRTSLLLALPATLLTLGAACGGGEPPAPEESACPLVGNKVDGKTFVMVEATPEGDVLNRKARMHFTKEDGALKLDYTIKSLVNVLDYTCTEDGSGMKCVTEPDLQRICTSLEVHEEGSCTLENAKKLGFEASEEDFAKAKEAAMAEIAQAKESPQWEQYKLAFNNVANAVQFVLYFKVNERKCRLDVDDLMKIVFNGETKEDYNPVGANPFAEVDEELLFVDCPKDGVFADHDAAELPEDLSALRPLSPRETGKPVHYFYLDEVELEPKEGCTYTQDLYANYKQVSAGTEVTAGEDGKLDWNASHTWADGDRMPLAQGKQGGVFTSVRKKTCGGETETIDAVCNYTVF